MASHLKKRSEVSGQDRWNLQLMYPHATAWEQEFEEVCPKAEGPKWPQLSLFKGKFEKGAPNLKEFLNLFFQLDRKIAKLYSYAHMCHDEDLGDEESKKRDGKIAALSHEWNRENAWVEPEILSISDEILTSYLKDEILKDYWFYIEKIIRQKPHVLSADKEELLALAARPLATISKAFGAFNNADLKFPDVKDSNGDLHPLTHGKFASYLKSKDRTLRKEAFEGIYSTFAAFENTLCELLQGQVQNHYFHMRARSFDSCLEASLFPNQIDPAVYTNLIDTVRQQLPILHRYMHLRKKALKLDKLQMYDLHVPIVQEVELRYDYQTAEELVIASVAPLGEEYRAILEKGLKRDRWVDRYENFRKRSGAYSGGCYDSMPYILLNFQGNLQDVMTLAHESGHSMHSFLTHRNQPYQYGNYSIFLAEVASTFNEKLVFKYLLDKNPNKEERAFLINQQIEDIRTTLFRQTMFAEFELWIHQQVESGITLTPGSLRQYYLQLNRDYFGEAVEVGNEVGIEWARIPHFYYSFYVYQYATGISAAHAIFELVTSEKGKGALDNYLQFLSLGSKHYPLDLLELAGVNMRDKQPIEATIAHFTHLVEELSNLV